MFKMQIMVILTDLWWLNTWEMELFRKLRYKININYKNQIKSKFRFNYILGEIVSFCAWTEDVWTFTHSNCRHHEMYIWVLLGKNRCRGKPHLHCMSTHTSACSLKGKQVRDYITYRKQTGEENLWSAEKTDASSAFFSFTNNVSNYGLPGVFMLKAAGCWMSQWPFPPL